MIENMTAEDWKNSLESKYLGTLNLGKALQRSNLDFYILLSSAASLVGSRGSANYAAGNAYLDAFAHAPSVASCRCLSLNIGLVDGAQINTPSIERNLRGHGLFKMTSAMLSNFFEYAFKAVFDDGGPKQIATGFDSTSISRAKVHNTVSTNLMFSHLWQSSRTQVSQERITSTESLKDFISESNDPAAVRETIVKSVSDKIGEFVVLKQTPIDNTVSMQSLGLDSLVTIELKNWIAEAFQASVQASEILDQANIQAVAALIESRSKLINQGSGSKAQDLSKADLSSPDTVLSDLPLPDLKESLRKYVECRKCFQTPEEFQKTLSAVERFQDKDGLGCKLQARLAARQESEHDPWQWRLYAEDIYLSRRDPLHPYVIFYGGHIVSDELLHSQVERASIITHAAFIFKVQVESGTLETNTLNEEPLCMRTVPWLFNSCREPHVAVDQMRRYPGHDHVAILRRGHVFRMKLRNEEGEIIPISELKTCFQSIIERSREAVPAVTCLTSGERNAWAEVCRITGSNYKANKIDRSMENYHLSIKRTKTPLQWWSRPHL